MSKVRETSRFLACLVHAADWTGSLRVGVRHVARRMDFNEAEAAFYVRARVITAAQFLRD